MEEKPLPESLEGHWVAGCTIDIPEPQPRNVFAAIHERVRKELRPLFKLLWPDS